MDNPTNQDLLAALASQTLQHQKDNITVYISELGEYVPVTKIRLATENDDVVDPECLILEV